MRFVRLISFLASIIFTSIYEFVFLKTFYWLYIENEFKEKLEDSIPDLLYVSVLAFASLQLSFGYFVNLAILLKESTLWQFASTPDSDYRPIGDKIIEWSISFGEIFGCNPDI